MDSRIKSHLKGIFIWDIRSRAKFVALICPIFSSDQKYHAYEDFPLGTNGQYIHFISGQISSYNFNLGVQI